MVCFCQGQVTTYSERERETETHTYSVTKAESETGIHLLIDVDFSLHSFFQFVHSHLFSVLQHAFDTVVYRNTMKEENELRKTEEDGCWTGIDGSELGP